MENVLLKIAEIDCIAKNNSSETSLEFVNNGITIKYIIDGFCNSKKSKYFKFFVRRLILREDKTIESSSSPNFNFTNKSEYDLLYSVPNIPNLSTGDGQYLRALNGLISQITELEGDFISNGHQPFDPSTGDLRPEYLP